MLQPIALVCSADQRSTGSMSVRTGLIVSLTIPKQPILEFADVGTERMSGLINCGLQIHRECEKKDGDHYDHPEHDQSDGCLDIGDQ